MKKRQLKFCADSLIPPKLCDKERVRSYAGTYSFRATENREESENDKSYCKRYGWYTSCK